MTHFLGGGKNYYTWNPYNLINQYLPNKFNKIKKNFQESHNLYLLTPNS